MRSIIFLIALLFSMLSFAWSAGGHRVVAFIAYQHLDGKTREHVDQLTKIKDPGYAPLTRFLYASTWPDQLRGQGVTMYNTWHYINIPGSKEHPQNVVWAIHEMIKTLKSPYAKLQQKATALYFLIHFVGDVHQPLHASAREQGGNTYIVDAGKSKNLHAFWDRGLGLLNQKRVKQLAQKIERQYPESYFGDKVKDMEAYNWAGESFAIANRFAYGTPKYRKPSRAYVLRGLELIKQRLALAGYRLAHLLNELFR